MPRNTTHESPQASSDGLSRRYRVCRWSFVSRDLAFSESRMLRPCMWHQCESVTVASGLCDQLDRPHSIPQMHGCGVPKNGIAAGLPYMRLYSRVHYFLSAHSRRCSQVAPESMSTPNAHAVSVLLQRRIVRLRLVAASAVTLHHLAFVRREAGRTSDENQHGDDDLRAAGPSSN